MLKLPSLLRSLPRKNCDFSQLKQFIRPLCRVPDINTPGSERIQYELVYKLNFIPFLSALNKLKKYQMAVTATTVPVTFGLEYLEIVPDGLTDSALVTGVGLTAFLVLIGLATKNTVAFLYTSPDRKHIRVSYMDFWGNRVNIEDTADQWVPFSELPMSQLSKAFISPRLYNKDITMKLFRGAGIETKPDVMHQVFGNIDDTH